MIVLGIDPGLATTGWGVVEKKGSRLKVIDFGVITTKHQTPHVKRLREIYYGVVELVKNFQPNQIAVEDLFFYKNVKTALKVAEARGVVLLVAAEHSLLLSEPTPLQVKQAVTSYGRANKSQVQEMVKAILGLTSIPKPDDAADALAVAVTCIHRQRLGSVAK